MTKKINALIFSAFHIVAAVAQVAVLEINFLSNYESQNGLGWPRTINVAEGHDALLKLVKPVVNQESCVITTARGVSFDVASPPNNRYESWGDGNCGVRIHNVTADDEGRWRMTASRGEYSITGFSEVNVVGVSLHYETNSIFLEDGQANVPVNLAIDSSQYCAVQQPFGASSLIPGHCVITLDKASRAVQGLWSVYLALPGRVSEYHVTRRIAVEAEHLDVGYIHDSQAQKLHFYCNILNSHRNISFCRFQRTSSQYGLNVVDGLSDGRHSYYGEGFYQKQCGMTVERPTNEDFASWRCSVGIQEWQGSHVVQRSPMQALITVRRQSANSRSVIKTTQEESVLRTIFTQRSQEMTVSCQADFQLRYCWFQSPGGELYTPVALYEDGQEFWYSGEGINVGDCGITFAAARDEFDGIWTCHMGPSSLVGLEEIDRVEVRVTGALTANQKEVEAEVDGEVTLYCHSSNGNRPLDYCRFVTPNFQGINLDTNVTKELAILGQYFFTPNRSLDHGDCSLTIDPVRAEDIGIWTCAAIVDGTAFEAQDTIHVYASDSPTGDITEDITEGQGARAGIIGMSVGLVVLGVVLAGFAWHKYGKALPMPRLPWRRGEVSSQSPIELTESRYSGSSGSSGGSTEILSR